MKKFGGVWLWDMAKRSVVVMFLFVGGISIYLGGCEDTDRIDRLIAQKGELRSDLSSLRGQLYDSKLLVEGLSKSKTKLQTSIRKLEIDIKNLKALADQVPGLKNEMNRLIVERKKLIAELAYEESKVLKSVVVGDLNLQEREIQKYSFEIPKNAKDIVFAGKSNSEKIALPFTFLLFDERNLLLWKANEKSKVWWEQSAYKINNVEKHLPPEKDVYYLVIIAPERLLTLDPEILTVNVEFYVRYRIEVLRAL